MMHVKHLFKNFIAVLIAPLIMLSCSDDDPVITTEVVSCFTAQEGIQAGISTEFNSSCSKNAISYAWSFGDGKISINANPVHTYINGGEYEVKLVVTGSDGASDSTLTTVSVEDIPETAITTHFGDIDEDEIWASGVHKIFGLVTINDATVTIEPGVVILMSQNSHLDVGTRDGVTNARLIAEGTADQGILITADSDSPTKGFWEDIVFGNGDAGSSMKYVTIEYGGDETYNSMLSKYGDVPLSMENSIIQNSGGIGMEINEAGFSTFENNSITACESFLMDIHPNAVNTIGTGNIFDQENFIQVQNRNYTLAEGVWRKQTSPYFIQGDVLVNSESGASLRIEAGTNIKFGMGASIKVGYSSATPGKLIAEGSELSPITFSALEQDKRWYGIQFQEGTDPMSSLKYCEFEHTSGSATNRKAAIIVDNASININNVTVRDALLYGVYCEEEGRFETFENNIIDNPADDGVFIYANWVHTLGNTNTINAEIEVLVKSDIIDHEAVTWKKQSFPYSISGKIEIGNDINGSMLTISPGTTISFLFNDYIQTYAYGSAGGGIIADGTANEPIIFTGGKETPEPGDWSRIKLGNNTLDGTIFNHCVFEYGGYYDAPLEVHYTDVPVITNNTFQNNKTYGLLLKGSNPTVNSNTFTNNGTGDILTMQ